MGGLDQGAVFDVEHAVLGEVGLDDGAGDLVEGFAFRRAAPALGVGVLGGGGTGGVGVGAPCRLGQVGEGAGQPHQRGRVRAGRDGGDTGGETALARFPGRDQLVPFGIDAVAGHEVVPPVIRSAMPPTIEPF